MPFYDRQDAGLLLAEHLTAHKDQKAIVLALPRGGVAVALPIAQALGAPLELLIVRKIGVPGYREVAMGAIVDGDTPIVVRNEEVLSDLRIPDHIFDAAAQSELAEIERRRSAYLSKNHPTDLRGRAVIVVDDGVATGATLKAALRGIASKAPASIVVAVPVAPTELVEELRCEVSDFICLEPLGPVGAVGAHYRSFDQLSDDDVLRLMEAAPKPSIDVREATSETGK